MDQTLTASRLGMERSSPFQLPDLLHNVCEGSSNVVSADCVDLSTLTANSSKCCPRMTLNNAILKVSNSTNTNKTKPNNVSFATSGGTVIPNSQFYDDRRKDELKPLWYSREELMDSCNEAKEIVKLIHLVGGKLEEIDHSRHCVVGLEKYHGKKEREKYRKLLIRSVLIRQEMNRGLGLGTEENQCLSDISQMMSSAFKDFALWQAAMHQFHAYGNSQPPQSLLLQQTQQKELTLNSSSFSSNHTTTSNHSTVYTMDQCDLQQPAGTNNEVTAAVSFESRKTDALTIDSARLPIECTNNPTSSSSRITSARLKRDFDQHAIVHRTQSLRSSLEHDEEQQHKKKRPQEHLQDVKTIMDGYVERKRLRSEVGHLMGAAQLIGPTQIMGFHSVSTP